jgi:hypothetical protein
MESAIKKKNIALLFCGQTRTNPLSNNSVKHEIITDAWEKYIFTERFKELYKYDIYISTDDIDIDKTLEYFGKENIKNIHTLDNDWYLNPVKNKIPSQSTVDSSIEKAPEGYVDHSHIIPQYYKLFDAYNLINNNAVEYDYITRLRFDTVIHTDILECLNRLESGGPDLIVYVDMFLLGRPAVMNYILQFIHSINKLNVYSDKTLGKMLLWDSKLLPADEKLWAYSPEGQISEYLRQYYLKQNIDAETKIINMDMSRIIKKNGHIISW